jgi:hypothetical protein
MVASYIETLRSSLTHDPHNAAIGKSRSRERKSTLEKQALRYRRRENTAVRAEQKGEGKSAGKDYACPRSAGGKSLLGKTSGKGSMTGGSEEVTSRTNARLCCMLRNRQ